MTALPQHPSAEVLLSHDDWVRALARTLVLDPDRADDVAQEAWLNALERPPRDERNLRGWLSQIVRNAARQRHRSQTRRDAREHVELSVTEQGARTSALHSIVQKRGDGFPVCTVSENAATLVLYTGDVELRRVALDLRTSELEIVTLP